MKNTLSSVGRAACAISSTMRAAQSAAIRNNIFLLSDITSIARSFRNRYLELFEANQTEYLLLYNSLHKYGTGLEDRQYRNWLSYAQRIELFFRGRPKSLPAMMFDHRQNREFIET